MFEVLNVFFGGSTGSSKRSIGMPHPWAPGGTGRPSGYTSCRPVQGFSSVCCEPVSVMGGTTKGARSNAVQTEYWTTESLNKSTGMPMEPAIGTNVSLRESTVSRNGRYAPDTPGVSYRTDPS